LLEFISKRKSKLKKKMMALFTDLKIAGINIKFTCCDDSGESKAFQKECQSSVLNIVFELSGHLNATAKLK
jgi:hypothetical protein